MSVEVLVLEDRPEAYRAGVVEARSGLAHRSTDAECPAELDDSMIAELRSSVGVKPNSA
jgi:hypothetical protein